MSKREDYYAKRRNALEATAERRRLVDYQKYLEDHSLHEKNWRKWGCYLSERQWGTVRENYGDVNNSWGDDSAAFPRDQALHRAYRWGEDGIAGISDDKQLLCFALAVWNGVDPCLKERLYGLTNGEGIHGEDVKEYYFYCDNTPTHSYMNYLYKYPYQYPYTDLYQKRRSIAPFEFELSDSGAFANDQYFDVQIEYAKQAVEDICIRLTVTNCGPIPKTFHLLPTIWFRNLHAFTDNAVAKRLRALDDNTIEIAQQDATSRRVMWLHAQSAPHELLFTDNETDNVAAFGTPNTHGGYYKNGINHYILGKYQQQLSPEQLGRFVNPERQGTKAAVHYELNLAAGQTATIALRLTNAQTTTPFDGFNDLFAARIREADEFYDALSPYDRGGSAADQDLYRIQRQAFAGLLFNKQFYHFVIKDWLSGDSKQNMKPPPVHTNDKNMRQWPHLYCADILLMPDKWEYPWFAAWDLAFHTVTVSLIDPEFAKHQLLLLAMEWYMHPNGQLPAYEWNFNNINPPVHAWAALKVYEQEQEVYGQADRDFLRRVFDKLNQNFTWWVNRVDEDGNNIFSGGFLGLDNIRLVDLSKTDLALEQADGTAWMAMFCLNMMKMATELDEPDLQRSYLQHFIAICDAMHGDLGLWSKERGFFFDCAKTPTGRQSLEVFSLVGLVPLFAIEEIHAALDSSYGSDSFFNLNGTLDWLTKQRPDLLDGHPALNLENFLDPTTAGGRLSGYISLVNPANLKRILGALLDPTKFWSDFGVRSLAADTNYDFHFDSQTFNISYEPAESNKVSIMGGNSNWRGPVWFPLNFLVIDALRKFQSYLGNDYRLPAPYDAAQHTLDEICDELSARLIRIFRSDENGQRPVYGNNPLFSKPGWREWILFYEYFHGDIGAGLGASHQTGWTSLVANLIQDIGIRRTP